MMREYLFLVTASPGFLTRHGSAFRVLGGEDEHISREIGESNASRSLDDQEPLIGLDHS
jgi:hypothetical protein